jgi:hypothetical protein
MDPLKTAEGTGGAPTCLIWNQKATAYKNIYMEITNY